ncbi:MAG TPA: OmpA family protein [Acetobacteraceae bacterium]|nr:OmpA family protein [Acetobacteraceae bacterium]
MRNFIAPLILAPLMFVTVPAFAQSNPSADQIINSLKPTGNLTGGGTRGIRLAAPTGETSPQQITPAAAGTSGVTPSSHGTAHTAAARPRPAQPAEAAGRSVNLTVDFPNGSAELTPTAMATLDQLGKALSSTELASFKFRVEGHTDTVGSMTYNQTLSQQRADAVVSYIESKYGVPAARLEAVGMGEKGLLVQTPPQTPEPRNRRVEVINLGA